MAPNPIIEAAQKKLGPLPVWQWGAIAGAVAIGARALLPASGGGSFFRRADPNASPDAATAGGGIDRRPVAPFAGLDPGLGGQTAFVPGAGIMPGVTTPSPFLSVTTPEGVSISGDGLSAGDIGSILSSIFGPRSATPKVPKPRPSPARPSTARTPSGRTPVPTGSPSVAPKAAPRKAAPRKAAPKLISYTVKRGDTLWRIASNHCGSGTKWPGILAQNPGAVSRPGDAGTLRVGYTLKFACR